MEEVGEAGPLLCLARLAAPLQSGPPGWAQLSHLGSEEEQQQQRTGGPASSLPT